MLGPPPVNAVRGRVVSRTVLNDGVSVRMSRDLRSAAVLRDILTETPSFKTVLVRHGLERPGLDGFWGLGKLLKRNPSDKRY